MTVIAWPAALGGALLLLLAPLSAAAQVVSCTNADVERLESDAVSPWTGATVLEGAAATVEAIEARAGRPLIVRVGQLEGADFSGRIIENVCFEASDLSRSKWRGALLRKVAFANGQLGGADLQGATLDQVRFLNTEMEHLEARGSSWRHILVAGGQFSGADLSGASLADFERHCGWLTGEYDCYYGDDTKLVGARIDALRWDGAAPLDLSGAVITHARVSPIQVLVFAKARIDGPVVLVSPRSKIEVRLDPEEWDRLKQVYADWTDNPIDCRSPTPAEAFLCTQRNEFGWQSKAGYEYGALLRALDAASDAVVPKASHAGLRSAERECLAQRTQAETCLAGLYQSRTNTLISQMARATPPKPGTVRVYAGPVPPFSPAVSRTSLYRRLTPLYFADALSRLVVTAQDDGRLSIAGTAAGSNGHSCTAQGKDLILGDDGWYGGPGPSGTRIPVLQIVGDRAELYWDRDLDSDYVGCGARASFDIMRRLPVAPADALKEAEGALQ